MRALRRLPRSTGGSTLVELIVAAAIMSVGILGLFGAFRLITRSIFVSRGQTLATNLAQERVEYLKNINYYALLITTAPAVDNSFSPGLDYDTASYPPELISIAGITFTRYTHVSMVQVDDDVITDVTSSYPDTGMKQITVNIVWTDNGARKKWTLRNLLENPYVNPLDATLTGTITKASGGALQGAYVSVEQNPDWNGTTDASGNFNFKVYHGTYSVRASSSGYYNAVSSAQVVAKGGSRSYSLALTQIATGSVAGIAWYNPDLLISQVVAATHTFVGDGADGDSDPDEADVEYFELFNPTTAAFNIGENGATYPKPVTFRYADDAGNSRHIGWASGDNPYTRQTYVSTYVAAGKYYTVANSSWFCVNNTWVRADLYYYNTGASEHVDLIKDDAAGGLDIARYPEPYGGEPSDAVGWADADTATPPKYEGTPIPDIGGGNDGLGVPAGKQIVRVSSPGINMGGIGYYGRAYDSGSNNKDFLYAYSGSPSFFYTPYTMSNGTFPIVTGKPASGAFASASDYNSNSTATWTAYVTSGSLSLPYTRFILSGVSTGTWDVSIGFNSGSPFNLSVSQTISSVAVSQNAVTSVPSATSTPAWSAVNHYHVQLTSQTGVGFVRGTVTGATGSSLSNIRVEGGGNAKLTGSNGQFFMPVSSGTFNLIANPNNLNAAFIENVQPVTVTSSAITVQNFQLSLGGRLTGYATSGTTPLSNIVFTAMLDGSQAGSGTTDASGVFTIRNISTGTYTVAPVLEVGQDVNPNSRSAVLTTTGTLFVDTFTVTGAFGSILGTVSDASGLVTSGALVIASTAAIASTPPSIAGSSAPAMTPTYMVSSKADGTYALPVRGSNTYYVSVYVPVISGSSVSITTKTYSSIFVSPSGSTTKNISIP